MSAILIIQSESQRQIFLKKCVIVTNEESYITLILITLIHMCQFENNKPLYFTIHCNMWRNIDGNQISQRRLGIYAMKIEFTAVEMF